MSQLAPCPHCKRHLRISESTCPFCAADVSEKLAPKARAPLKTAGLSRAGILALGASMVVAGGGALDGCADEDEEMDESNVVPIYGAPVQSDAGGSDAAIRAPDASFAVPVYGAPIQPDAGNNQGGGAPLQPDAGNDPGRVSPVYGAPIQPDAGRADAGRPSFGKPDSGTEDAGRIVPVYGAPITIYGAPVQPPLEPPEKK